MDQFRVVSPKQQMQCIPKHTDTNNASEMVQVPPSRHPSHVSGIERAQNFIQLKKYCSPVKLGRGKRYSGQFKQIAHVRRNSHLLQVLQITNTVVPLVLVQMSLRLLQSFSSHTHNSFSGASFAIMKIPWNLHSCVTQASSGVFKWYDNLCPAYLSLCQQESLFA